MRAPNARSFILLVTWFFGPRPLDSYQVTFSSREACEAAQMELKKEEARLFPIFGGGQTRKSKGPFAREVVPVLSAVCVTR
jgi:hypothetical protein